MKVYWNRFNTSLIFFIILFFRNHDIFCQDLLVSGGNNVSAIICANGFVYTWGDNSNDQLGNGAAAANVLSPLAVTFPADAYFTSLLEGITIRAVDAGSGAHFVALDCRQGVWSWGNNTVGQVGIGTTTPAVSAPTRVDRGESPGGAYLHASLSNYLVGVRYISGGNDNSYCIMNDRRAMAWGRNDKGQLGNGNTISSSSPVYVKIPGNAFLDDVIQIEAGDETAYALVDPDGDGLGTVYSWGAGKGTFGSEGMLGRNAAGTANSGSENTDDTYARPVLRADGSPLNNIVSISAGDILCLALDADGYVWAWGDGGWGGGTGIGSTTVHSDPRRVVAGEWGTISGAGFGETYLKAKAISGGQGFAMAVSVDGVPLAWGNNGACATNSAGGHLGDGGSASSNKPVIIRTSATTYHTNVVSISDGDMWGFYTTTDNQIFTWGNNAKGQLGINSTTCQSYATSFTLPACTFPAPLPYASISPRDRSVCASSFGGISLDCQFAIGAALASDYRIDWYRDNVLQQSGNGNTTTYMAMSAGTYRVEVRYIGTDKPCGSNEPAIDEITLSPYIQQYTVPSPQTFCNTLSPYVSGDGVYLWYKDATGGSPLDTTNLRDSIALISKASANSPVAGVYTVYVEERGTYAGEFGKVNPLNCATITTQTIPNARNIVFTMSADSVIIDTISFYVQGETGAAQNFTWELNIYSTRTHNGRQVADAIVYTTPPTTLLNPSNGGAWTLVKIPVHRMLSGPSGTSYAIGFRSNGNNARVADFNCNLVGSTDDITTGGPYLTSLGAELNMNYSAAWGSIANVVFHTPQGFCNRVPVTLTESCPCVPPNSVNVSPTPTIGRCVGSNQTIQGTVDINTLVPFYGYTYSWLKGSTVLSSGSSYADLNLTNLSSGDAGTYTLRVEDGTGNSSSCYREASVVISVESLPLPGAIGNDTTLCTGTSAGTLQELSSSSVSTFQWQISTTSASSGFSDISGAASSTYNPGAISAVSYFRRMALGSVCPAVASNTITISTLAPMNAGSIGNDTTICASAVPAPFKQINPSTGGSGSYAYQWQSSTTSSISGFSDISSANSSAYAPGALNATTYFRRIDKDQAGNCPDQTTNVVTVQVQPILSAGTIQGNQTICYQTLPSITIQSVADASGGIPGYTYRWEESTDKLTWGIAHGTHSNSTYTPDSALTKTIYYRRIVTDASGSSCNSVASNIDSIVVYNQVKQGTFVSSLGNNDTACENTVIRFEEIDNAKGGHPSGFTHQWQISADNGVTWNPASGISTQINYSTPPLSPGVFIFRRADMNSCDTVYAPNNNSYQYTILPNATVSISLDNPTPSCKNDLVRFTATPVNKGTNPQYRWYIDNVLVSSVTDTFLERSTFQNNQTIRVELTSDVACALSNPAGSATEVIKIQDQVTPTISITNPGAYCVGQHPTFNATIQGGGSSPSIQWYLNGLATGITGTMYSNTALVSGDQVQASLTVGSGLSCMAAGLSDPFYSNLVTLSILPVPTPQWLTQDTAICEGSSAVLRAQHGSGTLTWSRNSNVLTGVSSSSLETSEAGWYVLTENNGACSTNTPALQVSVIPIPEVDAGLDQIVLVGSTVSLQGSGGLLSAWTPSAGLSDANNPTASFLASESIELTYTAYDASGTCSNSDQVFIRVERPIDVPNAFTPNGDSNNDAWEIKHIESFPNCQIKIFNRWGNLVYQSEGYNEPWKGDNFRNGEVLPSGTYFYVIELNSVNFREPLSGYVQLVK
ncbi:MAG: gliding motility-associated C-terminal domain-containing protein [Cytophagaceae bacterium]|jgi:gliding motility-associated-like protein|nr:gliding motility-associated C-terminal domain-containing protein [Cytophagaceae bacterium]